jgi:hypothetical protein
VFLVGFIFIFVISDSVDCKETLLRDGSDESVIEIVKIFLCLQHIRFQKLGMNFKEVSLCISVLRD